MNWLEATVYGLIQGLTEFLPISSTAHLRVIPALLGWGDRGAAFTAVLQLGTVVAVFIYFRQDVMRLLRGLGNDIRERRFGSTPDAKLAWWIGIGTVPVVLCGLLLKRQIKNEFRHLDVIAWSAIGFSLLLAAAEIRAHLALRKGKSPREESGITFGDVIFIGLFQALALIPGASRSGVTITAGLFAGLSRSASARFSFLLSLPSVLGAGLYELYSDRHELVATGSQIGELLWATLVAGVVGYASIAFLLRFLRRYSTISFIIYRIVLGIGILLLLKEGILNS